MANTMCQTLENKPNIINLSNLTINITRKKIKNIYIRITPPLGNIEISAPIRTSKKEIEEFIISKINWIKKNQENIKKHSENNILHKNYNYITGEEHYILGKKYNLNIIYCKGINKININTNSIDLYANKIGIKKLRKNILHNYYKKLLNNYIPSFINKWEKIIQVNVNNYKIRLMKSRWGSCNISNANINLNLELAKYPIECLEYVIVHELVHLLEASHNKRFYNFMDRFMPNWREYEKTLKNIHYDFTI